MRYRVETVVLRRQLLYVDARNQREARWLVLQRQNSTTPQAILTLRVERRPHKVRARKVVPK